MGTDTEYVLQAPLVVILITCLVKCVLQPETAEFTVGPISHDAVTTWIVISWHQRGVAVGVARVVRG